jgi:hypothetical protein
MTGGRNSCRVRETHHPPPICGAFCEPNRIVARQSAGSTRSLTGRRHHSLTALPLPIVKLGIAQAEGEHGVGQFLALPVAGMDTDEYGPVVAPLNVPRVKLRAVHGVGRREGDCPNFCLGKNGTVPLCDSKGVAILPETAAQF